jgi:hypothetical protein
MSRRNGRSNASRSKIQRVAKASYKAGRNSKKSHTGKVIGGILGAGGGPAGVALGIAIGSFFD